MDVYSNRAIYSRMPFMNATATLNEINRCKLQHDDVLITKDSEKADDIAIPAWVCDADEDLICGYHLAILRPLQKRIDGQYLSYALLYYQVAHQFHSYANGITRFGLRKDDILRVMLPKPPLPEQKAIAGILGSLDDRIELNRRMNATLEGMAQAFFKSWFVDFDPVIDNAIAAGNPIPPALQAKAELRMLNAESENSSSHHSLFPAAFEFTEQLGWIPQGWRLQKISDVAQLSWGDTKVTKKSYTEEGYTAYSAKGPDGFLPYHDFDKVGIVISAIGSNSGQTFLAHGKWSCIKNTIRLWAEESEDSTFYLYHAVSAPLFWPLRGSAQPFISQTDARNCRLLYPPKEVAESFGATARVLYENTWDNQSQNSNLTKLRDVLLPKLISGELRIPQAEQLTEEALA